MLRGSLSWCTKRDESITQLRKIVDEFPADLEKYFERIIERIDNRYKDEMTQTFLVIMDELQPLPLYAFRLLEQEREDPDYALQEHRRPLDEEELKPNHEKWKVRVRNRCGELLIVDSEPHAVFLSHSVDFLHRTVRDFLRDCYWNRLRDHLKQDFNPSVSLCKIYLCFSKGSPAQTSINTIIGLTEKLLYYAHEVEKRRDIEEETPLVAILDAFDEVNTSSSLTRRNHWTHARDSPIDQDLDHYAEEGNCNFLALTIQARLVKYVSAKLVTNPEQLKKSGRPLLDYALRPFRVTLIKMPYHSTRDDTSVDVDMVNLLIEHGANPNQKVHLNDGESVWGLFLIFAERIGWLEPEERLVQILSSFD